MQPENEKRTRGMCLAHVGHHAINFQVNQIFLRERSSGRRGAHSPLMLHKHISPQAA